VFPGGVPALEKEDLEEHLGDGLARAREMKSRQAAEKAKATATGQIKPERRKG